MAHTHSNILVHAIFSTKERRPLLDKDLKPGMTIRDSFGIESVAPKGARVFI